jgi:hypothetical protein
MSHDQDKKCLDDRIMVDTSSAATPGPHGFAAWRGMMNDWPRHARACILWPSQY